MQRNDKITQDNVQDYAILAILIVAMLTMGSFTFLTNSVSAKQNEDNNKETDDEEAGQRDLSLLRPMPQSQIVERETITAQEIKNTLESLLFFNKTETLEEFNIKQSAVAEKGKIEPLGVSGKKDRRVSMFSSAEPTISVKPISGSSSGSERLVAGAIDARAGLNCGVYKSKNGGKSWLDGGLIPGPFRTKDGTPLRFQGDPVVRYARNGDVFYSCMAFNFEFPGRSSIFVSKSKNDGSTWSAPVPVRRAANPPGGEFEANDKPWLAVDTFTHSPFRDNIYSCWSQYTSKGSTVNFARSTNLGKSFSSQIILDGSDGGAACNVAVDSDGRVYIAWIDAKANPDQLLVKKSINGGKSFGSTVRVNDVFVIPFNLPNSKFRTYTFPFIGTARNGDVHIVWADDRFRAQGFGSDILIATSTNHGSSWTTRIVNLADRTNTDQFSPTIDVGKGASNVETINVFYYDKRYVSDPFNTLLDITEAQSHARAKDRFTLSKVTDVSCDFVDFSPGDYIDSTVNRKSHVAWTDCRHGPTIFTDIGSSRP